MRNFSGKVAAITGAGSGMGRSLAVELARRGCHLALGDVNERGLAQTAAICAAHGVKITSQRLDVASRDAVFDWARRTRDAHGKVNLVFNNAGVSLAAPAGTARIEDFEWIMGINFWGVVHGTQAFLPYLRESGDGHVINTSSLFGLVAMPTQSAYNATKFAVRGFTEALRMELELEGAPVGVTCVHPGGVATNIATASRIDSSIAALTGQDIETHRRAANRLINVTTPEAAARQIIAGVERNARRVLVGADARRIDKLARLFGSAYQVFVLRFVRKSRERNLARQPAAARPTPSSSISKDPA
ncbi:short chain dehydrogenase family protein [Burkholderia pseudomallei MSHR7343]|uniref:SDR family NAD(P)-dependent oxidoreductase n=1 Tax=Burkholderia pseudomallei TaxID=28450 RepID=UPI00050DF5A9|nr:SDR family NAD(P)-dependent oxidoreductase [Burkholderia pseudomallei]KGD41564.1 short chain dehydrogenase family protein [Burkholderia pseudomallei]KGS29419.1 short chain dehydrogenase family protein [Burkholderia pseudomallei MSHR7343]KGV16744.1 short chain dehydrogenase family protein [Burkholderia pseudomallei MSHR4503]ONC73711.1 short-chain dehydrogenase [Burkholderia pseudomallei]